MNKLFNFAVQNYKKQIMQKLVQPILILSLFLIAALFSSCEKEGVSSLKINKSTLSVSLGLTDTISATVGFTGDLPDDLIKWSVADTTIVSIVSQSDGAKSVSTTESTVEKIIAIKAKKAGTTKITLSANDKTIDCVVTVAMRKFTFSNIIAVNYGDYYDIGTNNFEMLLYESSMSFNSEGRLTGDGNFLVIDFNIPVSQNSFMTGDFSASETGETNTFIPGLYDDESGNYYFSIIANSTNNIRSFKLVEGGSYKVTATTSGFKITGELVLEGGEVIQFEYAGNVSVTDEIDNVELNPVLTHGLLHYYGDFYKTSKSNNFSLYLAEASLNFTDTATRGDLLAMEVNVPLTVTDSLPNGTYNMMTELKTENLLPQTIIPGFYDKEYNEYGSWFYGEDKTKKLKTGAMTILKTGAKSYQISYNFMDRFGAVVSGTFNGDLEYTDKTKAASGVKMAKLPVKSKASFNANSIRKAVKSKRPLNH